MTPPTDTEAAAGRAVWLMGLLRGIAWRKVGLFLLSLMIFVLGLELMRTGARGLAPLITDLLRVSNPINGLGFGWVFAYTVMSGSPVAAASLTFFDTGLIDRASAFAMITGSRLGASLVVLLVGMIYMLRGHERLASLTTGLLALIVTASVYLPALPLGYLMMQSGVLDRMIGFYSGGAIVSAIDLIYGPAVDLLVRLLPEWVVFLVGLVVIVTSFNLLDRALPNFSLKESAFGQVARLLYRPIVTFSLGFGLTLITMSVSVSLGMLVPLSARGYIRRENLVPYIMGCNISTFIDTLMAGLLLGNPAAAVIVLAEMLSVLVVSLVILLLFFGFYERVVLRFVINITRTRKRLTVFLIAIFLLPVALLLVR
jgi:Na+/phosphate symporter